MNLEEDDSRPPEQADPTPLPFSVSELPRQPDFFATPSAPSSAGFSTSHPSLPEDIRVPWGWPDLALLAALAFGLTFFFLIAILLVLAPFGLRLSQLQTSPNEWGLIAVCSQILTDLALLAYLAAQIRLRFRAPFWGTIGWRPLRTPISRGGTVAVLICVGVFLAAVVTVASNAAPPKEVLPIEKLLVFPPTAILFMLTAVLVAPVVEETIFRGYLYPVAARSVGVIWGIVLTGTLFGLLHSLQLWGGWWQIALLIVVGIVFTTARAITKSVVASWILHISYNSIQVVVMAISMIGPRYFPHPH
jgi:uncharacterized protein